VIVEVKKTGVCYTDLLLGVLIIFRKESVVLMYMLLVCMDVQLRS